MMSESPCQGEGRGFESRRPLSCPVFELGDVEDVVEGRSVRLVADPPVLHIEPFEHRGVELALQLSAGSETLGSPAR